VSYDLQSLKLPRLSGRTLALFARFLESQAGGALAIPNLMRSGGLHRLHARQLSDPPTFYPLALTAARRLREQSDQPLSPDDLRTLPAGEGAPAPFPTIRTFAEAYRTGETTPEAVAERLLAAIAASDAGAQPLRAFIAVRRDDVLAQARAATARLRAGRPLSVLDGVPVAIKDEIDQVPYPTTVGTRIFGRSPATQDATVTARLRAAGALLIGKANMYEIGISPNSLNVHHGTVRNPHDRTRDAGGSSSGSAALVAAGLAPVAIGADGGGSVRIPAALCGLVGLKSTFGRVSEAGAAPLTWSMGHIGPIAATVEDVMLTWAVIAGPDARDPHTLHQPPVTVAGWNRPDLAGVRLGIYGEWFRHADSEIVARCEALLDRLVAAGATLVPIEIPWLNEMRIAHTVTILSEMATSMTNQGAPLHAFGAATRINLALGRAFSADDYLHAQRIRTHALDIFGRLFARVDAIITPTTAITAPTLPTDDGGHGWSDLSQVTELMRFVTPANLTGLPAITFPAGHTTTGLPIGMHALGRHWEEALLLRIAHVGVSSHR
jgi:Asp-tRNA(Asn)/Glu-tRNA(Gln) amidotransferase A subunit family amidase